MWLKVSDLPKYGEKIFSVIFVIHDSLTSFLQVF